MKDLETSLTGDSFDRLLINNIGFGNIFNLGGSAEAVTFNPEERQMLFSFTGERLAEKRTSREISQGGVITITGTAGDPSLTFAEQPTVLTRSAAKYSLLLTAPLLVLVHYLHSLVVPKQLVQFHQQNKHYSRLLEIPKTEDPQYMLDLVLSERLSGAAESVSFNPDENRCSSLSQEKEFPRREHPEKSVKVELSKYLRIQSSSHSCSSGRRNNSSYWRYQVQQSKRLCWIWYSQKLSGAAESLTFNPTERDMLFSFTGERIAERTTFRELGTAGKFTLPTEQAIDPLSRSLSNHSLTLMLLVTPLIFVPVHIKVQEPYLQSTMLMRHSLEVGYQGSGSIRTSGIALVQVQLFQPSRVYVWII